MPSDVTTAFVRAAHERLVVVTKGQALVLRTGGVLGTGVDSVLLGAGEQCAVAAGETMATRTMTAGTAGIVMHAGPETDEVIVDAPDFGAAVQDAHAGNVGQVPRSEQLPAAWAPSPNEPVRFRPKNVLITGGAGFIASFACERFVERYPHYTIVCLDVLDYCASRKNLARCFGQPNFHFIVGDIGNTELVRYILKHFNIDSILHFAAQSHVDNSFGNSIAFTQTNVLGTHALLECALEHEIKRFIHVSTDEVYGEVTEDGAHETAILNPTNPYSASKAAAEMLTKAYIKSFNMPISVSRGNNVYGPRQFPEKVIPKFVLRLLRGQKCCLHGDGSAKRTYVHVSDVARAFDIILHHGETQGVYNIGTHQEFTMRELAGLIVREMGLCVDGKTEDDFIEYVKDRKFNDARYGIDTTRLGEIGWQPSIDFLDGLRETIEWYRNLDPEHWDDHEAALASHPTFKLDT